MGTHMSVMSQTGVGLWQTFSAGVHITHFPAVVSQTGSGDLQSMSLVHGPPSIIIASATTQSGSDM
jgi:hypothetical protein